MVVRKRRVLAITIVICALLYLLLRSRSTPDTVVGSHIGPKSRLQVTGELHLANPLSSYIDLPASRKKLPKVQHGFFRQDKATKEKCLVRRNAVKEAIRHSWEGYREKAWKHDELAPATGGYRTTLGGWALTLVDSLDTLWLAGMKREFEEAVQVVAEIDFSTTTQLPINVFEITIRHLGGLLGAYDVSKGKSPLLLEKAQQLGDMLYGAFDTPNHMPITSWSRIGPGTEVASGRALIAEIGTLSLEFTRLSQLTGDPRYFDAVQRIADCLESQQNHTKIPGLFPDIVNARECYFGDGVLFSLGGSADSVYEYFPKQWQLLGGASDQYRRLYETAKQPMKDHVLFRPMIPTSDDILLAGVSHVKIPGRPELLPQVQHLSCFAGGMFALAAKLFDMPEDIETARKLVNGCFWAYKQTATGLMPEKFTAMTCMHDDSLCIWSKIKWASSLLHYNSHDNVPSDKHLSPSELMAAKAERLRLPLGIPTIASRNYELRPEAIESIFILYRITGDESLRDIAWEMFQSTTSATRSEYGFSSIEDVTRMDSRKTDKMESFWLAETLKYFWLIFEDQGVLSLDEWVFNTEAHAFKLGR
jgi:mannosyl-oligosaccharide alpha-1,2-mannosidase